LALSGLGAFVIVSPCRLDGQLLQPCGQQFELLVCAEFVEAVNERLKKLGAKLEQVRSRRYVFHYDEVAEAEAQGLCPTCSYPGF
jgi:hypothetical protein